MQETPTLSQADMILADMKRGQSITPIDALNNYGCFRLSARIYDLKEEGWPVWMDLVETPSGKRVASYYLNPDRAAWPKDKGASANAS